MNAISYTVRPARPADAAAVNDVIHRSFRVYADELPTAQPTVKALNETVADVTADVNEHRVFVAEDEGGRIVGSIRCRRLTDELAYVYRFGVDPDINNTGIGSRLLGQVIDECAAAGYTAIALHTNAKYFKLARYYYGKRFFVHSTETSRGYIRALFIKELTDAPYDISPAFSM